MNSLRKRILLELFITPSTVIPTLLGGSLLLLSEVLGGYAAFFGFVGILVGFGALLTNLVFNLGNISKRALKQWHEQQIQQRERELDNLDRRLQKTDDDRDETALRNLRSLYKSFSSDVSDGKIGDHVPPQMLQLVDEIFTTCITKLERSYEAYKTSRTMSGKLKNQLQQQRETIISEVETSVMELAGVINEVRALRFKTESHTLKTLQAKLSSQLEVAKATEEGLATMFDGGNEDRFKEYE